MATKAHSVLLPVILLTRASLSGVEPDCGLLLQVALHALQRVCFFGAVAVLLNITTHYNLLDRYC